MGNEGLPRISKLIFFFLITFTGVGCGYHFLGVSTFLRANKIEKIYIDRVLNNSLKTGVEMILANELTRAFSRDKNIKLVDSVAESDAILRVQIVDVLRQVGSTTTADQIPRNATFADKLPSDFRIATGYGVQISLLASLYSTKTKKAIWSRSLGASSGFPASNQAGEIGRTSALINESRLQNALKIAVRQASEDTHESLLESF